MWISFWTKLTRGPDGEVLMCRSIWLDVTARVLAEIETTHLREQTIYLQEELKAVHNFEEIIGQSPTLQQALENTRQVAPTDTSVLIYGETGTGKELIARALHSASLRCHRPLIKVNLRGPADRIGGKRIVWPRKRSLHRGAGKTNWSL